MREQIIGSIDMHIEIASSICLFKLHKHIEMSKAGTHIIICYLQIYSPPILCVGGNIYKVHSGIFRYAVYFSTGYSYIYIACLIPLILLVLVTVMLTCSTPWIQLVRCRGMRCVTINSVNLLTNVILYMCMLNTVIITSLIITFNVCHRNNL